jgi:hypothetical protein
LDSFELENAKISLEKGGHRLLHQNLLQSRDMGQSMQPIRKSMAWDIDL